MSAPVPSARAARLGSRDRADHPHARDRKCSIIRDHPAHPWGRITAHDDLEHWCPGKPTKIGP